MIVRGRLFAIASSCIVVSARAVGVDELVARNLEARGGATELAAIKTLKTSGKLRTDDQSELAFTRYQKAPDSSRTEVDLQGLIAVKAWDGRAAWQISPFDGRKDPEKMSEEDARALADDAPIGGPLLDWQARGSKIDYLGTEDVDGTLAHKLQVTLKNGDVETVYLDPDQFLEIRMVARRSVRGTQLESIIDYGDYEKVAGVYFPLAVSTEDKADGSVQTLQIEHAEANVAVDDHLFAFPANAGVAGK